MDYQDHVASQWPKLPEHQQRVLADHLSVGWQLFDITPEGWLTLYSDIPDLGKSCLIRADGRTAALVQGVA